MDKCKCEWCQRKPNPSGNGYCRKHYDQIRLHGHILDIRWRTDDNRVFVKGDYAELIVTDAHDNVQGVAKVSLEDIEKLKGFHWSDNGRGYVRSYVGTTPLYLHRYLMDCPDDMEVDHLNHDKYDNRRENLRIVTHAENQQNNFGRCVIRVDRKLSKPFAAKVIQNGKLAFCKYFSTEQEAISAVSEFKKLSQEETGEGPPLEK